MNHRKLNKNRTVTNSSRVLLMNVVFIAAACLLLAYYIVTANQLTALNYKIQRLEIKISGLSEENSILTADRIKVENSEFLAAFAEQIGMVGASNPIYVIDESDVALGR